MKLTTKQLSEQTGIHMTTLNGYLNRSYTFKQKYVTKVKGKFYIDSECIPDLKELISKLQHKVQHSKAAFIKL